LAREPDGPYFSPDVGQFWKRSGKLYLWNGQVLNATVPVGRYLPQPCDDFSHNYQLQKGTA
jgi:hypothetical protein